MNPYKKLEPHCFWTKQVGNNTTSEIDYDPFPKFTFSRENDAFATAGSCFAQHFARELKARGGRYTVSEVAHPLMSKEENGWGTFSARYGNIYSVKQLRELLEQSFGRRKPIIDLAQRPDGRWVDLLRPRAVPLGFSSSEEAIADRVFHLSQVRRIFETANVFVFTLGLTEIWTNVADGYAYPMCPGTAAGTYNPDEHEFKNSSFPEVYDDLMKSCELIHDQYPDCKILLTVSPVMLVASMEQRGAIQSSMVSKSILRLAADVVKNELSYVDYFPSFEIISGPQAKGQFFKDDARDVTPAGVMCVMDYFFKSRMHIGSDDIIRSNVDEHKNEGTPDIADLEAYFEVECDEILLGS
ncbi:MAG: GSCFA domain-containing protein [Rhodospirillales bacterium]|nr:GSCFA domain-containing protein [Rhodospirillales bacterium]